MRFLNTHPGIRHCLSRDSKGESREYQRSATNFDRFFPIGQLYLPLIEKKNRLCYADSAI